MTVAMTPAVCRLLFVCFFCTLWGGQVIAGDVVKSKDDAKNAAENAKETTQKALNKLSEAETCANGLTDHLGGKEALNDTFVKEKANCSAVAVKNATDEMDAANTTVTEEKVKALLTDAATEVKDFLTQLKLLNDMTQKINTTAQGVNAGNKDALKTEADGVKTLFTNAKTAANKAMTALKNAVTELSKPKQKDNEDTDLNKKGEGSGQTNGVGNKEGKKSSSGAKDPPTHNSPGTEGDKSSTEGQHKNESTSSSTHEDYTPDGAHGGAIATCTAAPLLLLLTAVAYAAVC